MKLEDQVCSLDFAKKLMELGAKQESLFFYERDEYQMRYPEGLRDILPSIKMLGEAIDTREGDYAAPDKDSIAAFTVAELGEMLKPHRKVVRDNVIADNLSGEQFFASLFSADFYAKMLVYLIENHLVPSSPTTSSKAKTK